MFKGLRNSLARFFSPITRGLARLIRGFRSAGRSGLLRFFRQVGKLLLFVFWGIVGWCACLNLRLLLQGLPASALGAGALTVLCWAAFTPPQDIETRYRDRAQNALRSKEFAEAMTCFERLSHLQGDRPDVVFEWAQAAGATDQKARCLLLMNQLAPPERQGYARAHLWQAIRLMATDRTAHGRQLAETHLLRAIEGQVEEKEIAHAALGEQYLNKGLLDQAEPHLQLAVKSKPEVRLLLMQLYARQKKIDSAMREGKAAINYYSTLAKADLFNFYARTRWAEALAFLEDFDQAVAVLHEGLTGTHDPRYRAFLAQAFVSWFDHLGRNGSAVTAERFAKLEIGLRFDPANRRLLDRVLSMTSVRRHFSVSPTLAAAAAGLGGTPAPFALPALWAADANNKADAARALLRRLLAEGHVTAQLHFALGVDALERGEQKEARYHWERALQLDPNIPDVANNLAALLYHFAPNEISKALDLANLAVEKTPNQTAFRDTRGYILFKMGRYREAAADLEAALTASPNKIQLHRTLAEIYERLELPQLAALHLQLAAEKNGKTNK